MPSIGDIGFGGFGDLGGGPSFSDGRISGAVSFGDFVFKGDKPKTLLDEAKAAIPLILLGLAAYYLIKGGN